MRKEAFIQWRRCLQPSGIYRFWPGLFGSGSEPAARSHNPGPEPALELRPRIALSSAQVQVRLADLDASRQHRTFHLLIKPDILTCYGHDLIAA
jgi:hypothetical protein